MTYYFNITTTSASTYTMPLTTSGTSWAQVPERPKTALEWLDSEVERTCALARSL